MNYSSNKKKSIGTSYVFIFFENCHTIYFTFFNDNISET